MVLCFCLIAFVIILEAGPVYYIFMANLRDWNISLLQIIWSTVSFGFAFFLCLLAIFYPMYLGEKRLRIR